MRACTPHYSIKYIDVQTLKTFSLILQLLKSSSCNKNTDVDTILNILALKERFRHIWRYYHINGFAGNIA